jgi:hypothetical protein
LNNTGKNLAYYQKNFSVDTQSLIASGRMNVDGLDIRFVNSDGVTLLPFWNETKFNLANTKIWVNITSISNVTSTTVYMYYGNPSALSSSNGTATFEFFDDAESGTFSKKWINVAGKGGSYSKDYAYSGRYSIKNTGADALIASKSPGFKDAVFEANVMANNYSGMFTARTSATSKTYYGFRPRNAETNSAELNLLTRGAYILLNSTTSSDNYSVWADWKIIANGSSITTYYNNNLRNSAQNSSILSGLVGSRSGSYLTNTIYLDNVRVRKYASSEPAYSFGAEEIQT